MQRHVNDWVGTLKAAIPYLQEMEADNIHDPSVGLRRDEKLTAVLQEAKDIVKAAEDTLAMLGNQAPTFESELKTLINRYSLENGSNTPDYILADHLKKCLIVFDATIQDRAKWHGEVLPRVPIDVEIARKVANEADALKKRQFDAGGVYENKGKFEARKEINKNVTDAAYSKIKKNAAREIMADIEQKTSEMLHGFKKTFEYVPAGLLEEFNRVNTELAELWSEGRVSSQEYKDLQKRANELAESMNQAKEEAIEKEAADKAARIVADLKRVADGFANAAKAIQVFNKESKAGDIPKKITDENGFLFINGNEKILWAIHHSDKYRFYTWDGSHWIGWDVSEKEVIEATHTQLPIYLDQFIRSFYPMKKRNLIF